MLHSLTFQVVLRLREAEITKVKHKGSEVKIDMLLFRRKATSILSHKKVHIFEMCKYLCQLDFWWHMLDFMKSFSRRFNIWTPYRWGPAPKYWWNTPSPGGWTTIYITVIKVNIYVIDSLINCFCQGLRASSMSTS